MCWTPSCSAPGATRWSCEYKMNFPFCNPTQHKFLHSGVQQVKVTVNTNINEDAAATTTAAPKTRDPASPSEEIDADAAATTSSFLSCTKQLLEALHRIAGGLRHLTCCRNVAGSRGRRSAAHPRTQAGIFASSRVTSPDFS